jgi:hypothetical protein
MSCETYERTVRTGTVRIERAGKRIRVKFPNGTKTFVSTPRAADRAACAYLGKCCARDRIGVGDVVWAGVVPP